MVYTCQVFNNEGTGQEKQKSVFYLFRMFFGNIEHEVNC